MSPSNTEIAAQNSEVSNSLESLSDDLAFGVTFAITLTIVQRGVGFLRGLLFCGLLSEKELGQWSMADSFLMLLAPLAVLGLPGSFSRFVEHYRQNGQLFTYLKRITWVSGLLTIGFCIYMMLFPEVFSRQIFGSENYIAIVRAMSVALIFVTANNFMSTLMESMRQLRRATLMRFITGIGFAVFGTGLILISESGIIATTIGFGIACLVGMYPGLAFLVKHRSKMDDTGKFLTHKSMWIRIVPFAIWLWASNFVTNMFEVADRYMLVHWSVFEIETVHEFLGQYHSGRVLPKLFIGVSAIISGMMIPYLSGHWEKKEFSQAKKLLNRGTKLSAIGFSIAGIVMVALAPILFDLVFKGKFEDGLAILPATTLYCIWFSLIGIVTTYLLVIEKGHLMFAVIGVGLLLNMILNMLLIPEIALWGAVTATTISMFLTTLMAIGVNRLHGLDLDFSVVLCILFPTVLLAPVYVAIPVSLIFLALTFTTGVIFDAEEREVFRAKLAAIKNRFQKSESEK